MSTITKAQEKAILDFVESHDIPAGLGDEEKACSIASINLALTGELTDRIPECMSPVIGKWIIRVQDLMPAKIRNSEEWKRLLPFAAGTGREFEQERRELILKWMWTTVMPTLQPLADKQGFGKEWSTMLTEKTYESAKVAKAAADAAYAAYAAYAAADAAYAAAAAAYAAYAAAAATDATDAADAATDAADAAAYAAYAATDAADAAAYAAYAAWENFNPVELLAELIEAGK